MVIVRIISPVLLSTHHSKQRQWVRSGLTRSNADIGQKRMQPGKQCPYETDINIPFIVRGPNVPAGNTVNVTSSHTDVAPMIFEMFGIPTMDDFDGSSIPFTAEKLTGETAKSEHVIVEYWGNMTGGEGPIGYGSGPKFNTYKALRVFGSGYNLYYSVWCKDNEHELYVSPSKYRPVF